MWSYYELIVAQDQADRRVSVGYTVAPTAAREFPTDAIARSFAEQSRAKRIQDQHAQMAIMFLYDAMKAFFRGNIAVVR
jgi:hypothetical protein